MKTFHVITLALILELAGLAFMFSGCTTTPVVSNGVTNLVTVLKPEVLTAVRGVLAVATPVAVQEDPNAAPYLRLVAGVFALSAASGVYDPATIQTALEAISIKELRDSGTARKVVLIALATYKGTYADAVNAKMAAAKWGPFAQGLLGAMADGINAGLPAQ